MQKNADHKNSEYGHFLHNANDSQILEKFPILVTLSTSKTKKSIKTIFDTIRENFEYRNEGSGFKIDSCGPQHE